MLGSPAWAAAHTSDGARCGGGRAGQPVCDLSRQACNLPSTSFLIASVPRALCQYYCENQKTSLKNIPNKRTWLVHSRCSQIQIEPSQRSSSFPSFMYTFSHQMFSTLPL